VLRLTDGGGGPVESQLEAETVAAIGGALASARLIVWCDHGFGGVTPGLVWAVNSAARRNGALIVGHAPGPRGDLARLRGAHLLTMTERKLRTAMNDMESGLSAVTWSLLNQTEGRMALVTLRKRGLVSFDGRRDGAPSENLPDPKDQRDQPPGASNTPSECARHFTPERLKSEFVHFAGAHPIDLLGCDEAVLGTAGLALACGGSLPLAAYLAGMAETLAGERPGRSNITIESLRDRLFQRSELSDESRFLAEPAPAAPSGADIGSGQCPGMTRSSREEPQAAIDTPAVLECEW
jgi:bifunctional ADP-heptose synthase (sugar kinase/adenylyltransferase)